MPPDRTFPVELEMSEPGRRPHNRKTAPMDRVRDPSAVRRRAELNPLCQVGSHMIAPTGDEPLLDIPADWPIASVFDGGRDVGCCQLDLTLLISDRPEVDALAAGLGIARQKRGAMLGGAHTGPLAELLDPTP